MSENELLDPVSDEAPCGEDLEYDARFIQLEEAAQGKPERQIGDIVEPAEPPDWKHVAALAADVLRASKDLRAAAHYAIARAHVDHLPGIAAGLGLIHGLLERYWDCLHPRLDPDDDFDPTIRFNALAVLGTAEGLLTPLLDAPLACARGIGCFSLRDHEIATGKRHPPEGMTEPPTEALIEAAFLQAAPESLEETAAMVQASREALSGIQRILQEKAQRPDQLPNMDRLAKQLHEADRLLQDMIARRQGQAPGEAATPETAEALSPGEDAPTDAGASRAVTVSVQGIRNRDDVIRMLDSICEFYARNEPASPVPVLLRRARRLVHKDFVDIVRDLLPDAMSRVEDLMGPEEEEG